ncbi:hypothetical protein NZD89_22225 [Alicyclobacillus fastidiosus]|uniref:Uncharacterized protein n=1 Tax=Alicyclobacillus fastidiosus TaxID=392011 RepID=A0ABY6ZFW8_9BACL|nr:hypothetical protein [Alicyclobacillus fastidiosus]WAH40976.1 hypothetical protein NZD89_22225 [Alicyclobacillus fastidiosus]
MDTNLLEVHLLQEENKIELRTAFVNLPTIRAIIDEQAGFTLLPPVDGSTGKALTQPSPDGEVAQMVRLTGGIYSNSIDGAEALIQCIRAKFAEDDLDIYLI